MPDAKGSHRKRAMPIGHEQIAVVIDGRSIVEAYTKRRLLLDLVIRHRHRMVRTLEEAVEKALRDGYVGLWATGDMTWEFGPEKDFTKLVEYEKRLDALFHRQGALCGICQYHKDTLAPKCVQQGLRLHGDILLATGA